MCSTPTVSLVSRRRRASWTPSQISSLTIKRRRKVTRCVCIIRGFIPNLQRGTSHPTHPLPPSCCRPPLMTATKSAKRPTRSRRRRMRNLPLARKRRPPARRRRPLARRPLPRAKNPKHPRRKRASHPAQRMTKVTPRKATPRRARTSRMAKTPRARLATARSLPLKPRPGRQQRPPLPRRSKRTASPAP